MMLLGLVVITPIIQFYLLHTPLPYGRTSIYYSFLFGIVIVLFLNLVNIEKK